MEPGTGTETPAPQDSQWERARFDSPMGWFPPAAPGDTIKSIEIIYDEGTDTPGPADKDPNGVGLANIDNIDINGHLVTHGPDQDHCDDRDRDHGHGGDHHDDDDRD